MATLGDVARRAGVSAASVSRVLNHPAKVSPEVRARVTRAMSELGYVRDGAARALASRHSLTIGNVVPTLGIGIFAVGVEAMQRRLEDFGYQLLVAASLYDEKKEALQVRALIERGVEGIALVGHRHAPEVYELLSARKLPYVNTYQFDGRNPHPCIGFDNRKGAFGLTRHLVDLGHRRFGIVTAPPSLNDRIAARLKGILDCLADCGITAPQLHVMEVAQTIHAGRGATRALLQANQALTALCCTTDTLAIGALLECKALGVRVPEDVLGRRLLRSRDRRRARSAAEHGPHPGRPDRDADRRFPARPHQRPGGGQKDRARSRRHHPPIDGTGADARGAVAGGADARGAVAGGSAAAQGALASPWTGVDESAIIALNQ